MRPFTLFCKEMEDLDPESYQTREVFAYFGRATFTAQCLEQAIIQDLIFFDHFPNAVATVKDKETWTARFDSFEAAELRRTLGMLIKRLRAEGQVTTSIEEHLDEVLEKRNWLAHRYFNERAVEFTLYDGRAKMLEELQEVHDLFRKVEVMINEVTRPISIKYGMTDEILARITLDMITQYKKEAEQDAPSNR